MSIRNNEKAQTYLQKKKVPELFEVSLVIMKPICLATPLHK